MTDDVVHQTPDHRAFVRHRVEIGWVKGSSARKGRIALGNRGVSQSFTRAFRLAGISAELLFEEQRGEEARKAFTQNNVALSADRRISANPNSRHRFGDAQRGNGIDPLAAERAIPEQDRAAVIEA